MRESLSAQAVLSVSDFKQKTAETLKRLQEVGPHILTQNGRSAAVLMTSEDYDYLTKQMHLLRAAVNGLMDELDNGTVSHEEIKRETEMLGKQRA